MVLKIQSFSFYRILRSWEVLKATDFTFINGNFKIISMVVSTSTVSQQLMQAWFSYPKIFWLYFQVDVATERNYHILGFLLSLRKIDFLIILPRALVSFPEDWCDTSNYNSQLKLIDVKGEIKFNFKDFHGHWNSQKLILELIFLSYR